MAILDPETGFPLPEWDPDPYEAEYPAPEPPPPSPSTPPPAPPPASGGTSPGETGRTTDESCGPGMHYDHGEGRCTSDFTDPVSNKAIQRVDYGYEQLNRPTNDPRANELFGFLREFMNRPSPYQGLLDQLSTQISEQTKMQRERSNLERERYEKYIVPRVAELRGEPWTQTEEAGRRVAAFDEMNRERTRAKARTMEQLGAMGHDRSSGLVARAMEEVDRRFDTLQAQGENRLLTEGERVRSARRSEADALMSGLAEFGLSDLALGQNQIPALAGAAGTFGNLGLGREQLNLGAMGQFGGLLNNIMGFDEARIRDAITTAMIGPGLQNENLKLALQLFGSGVQSPF